MSVRDEEPFKSHLRIQELEAQVKEWQVKCAFLENEIGVLRAPLEKVVNAKYAKDEAMNCLLGKLNELEAKAEQAEKLVAEYHEANQKRHFRIVELEAQLEEANKEIERLRK